MISIKVLNIPQPEITCQYIFNIKLFSPRGDSMIFQFSATPPVFAKYISRYIILFRSENEKKTTKELIVVVVLTELINESLP